MALILLVILRELGRGDIQDKRAASALRNLAAFVVGPTLSLFVVFAVIIGAKILAVL